MICPSWFPESLKARVFYDSSSFVSSTINEVVKTLAIAFALVVAVVFVFLAASAQRSSRWVARSRSA